ncbi:tyrosine-type recombinase/integrase [Nodularia spumigena]|uniref:tyrosine-type recombinase/integrase n=1 Tax=Nodularia spumigena TaxID=70799 RepID=UPI00232D5725|nr:tyrosine-type recombinase/integrase [Nodularia spumigena]MDB9324389.1 tyrosine-type recombinase/integrase [Nodularia spumigena CS-591/07A]MDB9330623.1 tyrosine-type recombinase/integrase [Nodularia spumigena CS-591/04]MDB9346666.1 tyrosine-type recombinase/integrase [Nodularia spumigena CS-588/01]MDB9402657.1 tyrosine-type recombinase/integrase [Microcystis aeruginosa CS-567/02-A1]MDB9302866.1 tyrosine-type recombinase/integrase [Nodularia spumigena CS-591/12]
MFSKSKKGQVSVRVDSGSVKACFPRTYFSNSKQVKLATGISLVEGWENVAARLQRRLQLELEDGKLEKSDGEFNITFYNSILEEYGLRAKLRLVSSPTSIAKPELSLLEVWDLYVEYKKPNVSYTYYIREFKGVYLNAIKAALSNVEETPLTIRTWLLDNRCRRIVKHTLINIDKAHTLALKRGLITVNLYDGIADDIDISVKGNNTINQLDVIEEDVDIFSKNKAFKWSEVEVILDYIKNNNRLKHWYEFIKFKFLTGVRTSEAIALWWVDIKWDKECIVIRRSYSEECRIFKSTKNNTERLFPMPKYGELYQLLKSLKEGEPNECVFKSKYGKVISINRLSKVWCGHKPSNTKGILPVLIEKGLISKYLPPYNTRHTFINHQIYDLGRDEKIVNSWCEHSIDTSRKFYQDISDKALHINPDKTTSEVELEKMKVQLEEQRRLIDELRGLR